MNYAVIMYSVFYLLVDLCWVDFDLGAPPSCPAAQLHLPYFHQHRQKWAVSGALKILVHPTQYTSKWDTLYFS